MSFRKAPTRVSATIGGKEIILETGRVATQAHGSVTIQCGGTVVLDATNGKSYADSASLRRSMLHLLGDREGNITPFLLQEYGSELVGFDRINGTYSTGKREGRMMLTVSADVQRTALAALDGRKGTVGVYNYKTGEILCAVSSPTYDPDDVPDVEGSPET